MRSIKWLCCRWPPLSTLTHLNFYILHCLMHLRNWRSQRLQIWCTGWMWKSQPTDDKLSLIGAWSGHMAHYKIFWASIISWERLKLKSSNFCIWVGCINLTNRMTCHQQKGRGYGHVTVLKFCNLSWCSASLSAASRRFVSDSWATGLNFVPIISVELVKLDTSNFMRWLIHRSTSECMIYYPKNGRVSVIWHV